MPAHVAALLLLAAPLPAQWTSGPAFPTPAGREHAAGLARQGRVYAFGGTPFDANEDAAVHSIAPGEAAWTVAPGVEGPLVRLACGVDGLDRVVLFGGVDGLDPEGDVGKTFSWDPVEGPKGDVAERSRTAPYDGLAFATDAAARLYSIGGGTGAPGDASAHVERYTAATDAWQVLAPLPAARAHAAATADGRGGILVAGGYDAAGAPAASVARFDVALGAWTASAFPDLPVATAGARAVLGADERVYVAGGRTAAGVTAAVWVLDQDAGVWSAGPPLADARELFGATLGPDDHVWVLGGTDDAGNGLASVERLYTPPCPAFAAPVEGGAPWSGMPLVLDAAVDGGAPLTYRWRRDGVELFDGPAVGGGTISGSDTPTLVIDPCAPADDGVYELVATNPCGAETGPAVPVAVRVPPDPTGGWVTWTLDAPSGLGAAAYAVDADALGGSATMPDPTYGSLGHAYLWRLGPAGPGAGADLTPAGSVGGAVLTIRDGVQAGWYWWPYTTPFGTAYDQHACTWSGTAASHAPTQPSGWEYGSVSRTDGTRFVGTLRFDDTSTTSDGHLWPGAGSFASNLTPSVAWGSATVALDGPYQYGNVNLGFGVVHAARWSGSAASFVDVNPDGSSWSYVLGAGSGQAVGRATFGGEHHAGLWDATGASFADLHPAGASWSEALAAHGGVQVGWAQLPERRARLWTGPGGATVDLQALLPAGITGATPRDVLVDDDGTITVVGSALDATSGTSRAVVWRRPAAPLIADASAVSAAAGGTQELGLYAGAEHQGALYLIAGSLTGTSPGTPWSGLVIPLNLDVYTTFSITHANQPPFVATFGVLDEQGRAGAAFELPPGVAIPGLPLTAHHAAAVIDPASGQAVLATNAVALEITP